MGICWLCARIKIASFWNEFLISPSILFVVSTFMIDSTEHEKVFSVGILIAFEPLKISEKGHIVT